MQNKKEESSMKYDDTYSMIGAIINQGFETQFEKERKKKEKRRTYFRKLLAFLAHQGKRFNCRNHKETICTCMADCGERA